MKWIDKTIAGFFPRYAIRRLQAQQSIKAFYESAKPSRLRKTRLDSPNPDAVVQNAASILRAQARHLDQNLDIAKGALDTLVANIVGTGIVPEPMVKDKKGDLHKEVNQQILDLWKNWIKHPEVTGDFDYYGAQRIACRSWLRDGEIFAQMLKSKVAGLDHQTAVQFSIELIEADFVPADYDEAGIGVVQGVEKNAWGRARAFYLLKTPPGSSLVSIQNRKRVSADNIIHLKLTDRVRQTRGVSIFASVIGRLDDIKEIEESERIAARVAAAMCAAIKKGAPDMYLAPDGNDKYRDMDFVPGMIFDDLMVGEEVGTIASNRPNNELIPFRNSQLKAVSAGVGASYSSLSKDYGGTFSSQRQELVEQYMIYGVMHQNFTDRFARRIYEGFATMALTSLVEIPSDVDRDTLLDASHSRPSMPWIDPKKELDAIEKELSTRITSRSQVIRRRGGNPDEVRKKIIEENTEDQEAGFIAEPATKNDEPEEKDND